MGGRKWVLGAVVASTLLPTTVLATPRPPPARPLPRPLATVDHPPSDQLNTFDFGPRDFRRVALTFDADMTPAMLQQLRSGEVRSWYNQEVREILDREQVPATVFLTGLWATAYPKEARVIAEDPLFEIGNHTHDHAAFRLPCYGLAKASDTEAEVQRAQDEILAVTGVTPKLLRFPGDCYAAADVELARAHGLLVISGEVRAGDGFNLSAGAISATVLNRLQPGSIVVLHLHGGPSAPMTAPALLAIISGARQRGYHFAKVSDLLQRPAAGRQPSGVELLSRLRRTCFELSQSGIRLGGGFPVPQ